MAADVAVDFVVDDEVFDLEEEREAFGGGDFDLVVCFSLFDDDELPNFLFLGVTSVEIEFPPWISSFSSLAFIRNTLPSWIFLAFFATVKF